MAIPRNFSAPIGLKTKKYIVRKLCVSDTYLDYLAVMSSINIIKQVRGGRWPQSTLSFEDDMIDLGWHQREFEFGNSFAYTIMNSRETKCLGCCYFYPIESSFPEKAKNYDIDFSFWITQEEYDKGFYVRMFRNFIKWIKKDWSKFRIYYRNQEIPKEVQELI